jgi:hypothetical protein
MYVRSAQRARTRRLAGAHRLSGLRGLRGLRRGLGQTPDVYLDPTTGNDVFNPITDLPVPTDVTITPTSPNTYSILGPTTIPTSGGGLTTADASVLSAAITAAGNVGKQAIIGTPTLTYNPATGQYVATGGATIPSSLATSSMISSYFPLILLAGGAILLISMMKK